MNMNGKFVAVIYKIVILLAVYCLTSTSYEIQHSDCRMVLLVALQKSLGFGGKLESTNKNGDTELQLQW